MVGVAILAGARDAAAVGVNTADINVYNAFAAGATVEDFENIAGMTPLAIDDYPTALDSSQAVAAGAQLSLDIPGLFFHSGGGSAGDPVGNPGTPTALLLLESPIDADARSATNVVGSLEINTEQLDLDHFIEIVFVNDLQSRVGLWLNPSLGDVTFTAFDANGQSLESLTGTAGNFVGVDVGTPQIKFVSVVGGTAGFTVDDLTFAAEEPPPGGDGAIPEPTPMVLMQLAAGGLLGWLSLRRRGV